MAEGGPQSRDLLVPPVTLEAPSPPGLRFPTCKGRRLDQQSPESSPKLPVEEVSLDQGGDGGSPTLACGGSQEGSPVWSSTSPPEGSSELPHLSGPQMCLRSTNRKKEGGDRGRGHPGKCCAFSPLPEAAPLSVHPLLGGIPETWKNWPDLSWHAVRTCSAAQIPRLRVNDSEIQDTEEGRL